MSEHGPQHWVGDWSARRARLSPDRTGLVDETTGREFTYADLDRRANRCARLLDGHGVTARGPTDNGDGDGARVPEAADARDPEDAGGRVAVVSRNRPEYVDLFFATGKTGGVLAPLSHRLAPPELAELLDVVDPSLLFVEEAFADLVADALDHEAWTDGTRKIDSTESGPTVLSLSDAGGETWTAYEEALPADESPFDGPAIAPGEPHLFLHTGGSTGTPKETVVSHEAIVWNSLNTITAWGLRDDDVTPMVFPMFHTGGWNVLTLPLFHMGATVTIAREFDAGAVLRSIGQREATVLVAVPAVLRRMTEHDRWAETDLSSLRFVKSGGGPCREVVMEAWWDRGVDLSQGYGLTECGPNNFAMPDDWPRERADTVGVPNLHVDARVVDDGEAVETGEIGELELRSPHAAGGYWENPDETADTFGSGWVSTGDLARVDADGFYSIEGRKKQLFVSGGENVYPARVEDVVARHEKVDEVVVVPVPDEEWGQVGKAVIEGDESLTLAELVSFLDGELARYEHPKHLVFVDEMPTSGPSKIDRETVERAFGESQSGPDG